MMFHFKLYVDLDNTVQKTNEALEGIFGPRPDPFTYFHPLAPQEFWGGEKIAEEIFRDATALPYAAETLRMLTRIFKISYLTARPAWTNKITRYWLKTSGFPECSIIHETAKHRLTNSSCIMIEDDAKQIENIAKTGAKIMILTYPWNINSQGYRFDWSELYASIVRAY